MPIPNGTKIGVSSEIPSLYFDSFLIAFVVSRKLQPIKCHVFADSLYSFCHKPLLWEQDTETSMYHLPPLHER